MQAHLLELPLALAVKEAEPKASEPFALAAREERGGRCQLLPPARPRAPRPDRREIPRVV